MTKPGKLPEPETDPRFPSGPWTGYFQQKLLPPGKHCMEMRLNFCAGIITGEGRDRVGSFIVHGRYDLADGRCRWHKRYQGKHDVYYQGYNEGKGIWGTWEIPSEAHLGSRGGFHIWPEGTPNPTGDHLYAAEELPMPFEETSQRERVKQPTG